MGKIAERVEQSRAIAHLDAAQSLRVALRHGRTLLAWLEEHGATRYEPTHEQDIDNMLTALDVLSGHLWRYRFAREQSRLAAELTAEVIEERSRIETPKATYATLAVGPPSPATSDMIEVPISEELLEKARNGDVYRQRVSAVRQAVSKSAVAPEPQVPGTEHERADAGGSSQTALAIYSGAPLVRCWLCQYETTERDAGAKCLRVRRGSTILCPGTFSVVNREEPSPTGSRFPCNNGKSYYTIPWDLAEKAYKAYAGQFRSASSMEAMRERGGFSFDELDCLLVCGKLHPHKHPHEEREQMRHTWIRQAWPV